MHNRKSTSVDWSYSGSTDLSFGTGATTAEKVLGYLGSSVGLVLYSYFFIKRIYPWSYWQYAVGGILAFDVAGGLVCNCLNSCKRFYSSPLQSTETSILVQLLKQHWIFTIVHIHPIIVQLCFGSSRSWFYGLFWYFALQLSAFIVMNIPLYLQRPTAMFICLISLILNYYIILPIEGLEWFIPALFIKIVYGHLVPEEPYRPITEQHSNVQ